MIWSSARCRPPTDREAASGERVIIERAGTPLAALVPLSDLDALDPERIRERRLGAIREMDRFARRIKRPPGFDAAAAIREMRQERADHIAGRHRREP